jgi:hypothetical protein
MPNGGSDCCGTCWFNARNKGEAGYDRADDPEPDFCTIRGLAIEVPFWTYCTNHPHHRLERDPIPIGPVFVNDGGFPYPRKQWQPSPDTEEVRLHLLALLGAIQEQPADEYPGGMYTDEMVVWQLGEFRERRAENDLRRIIAFDPAASGGRFGRTRESLVAVANEALAKLGGEAPSTTE